jgi:phosphatidylglycerophosphate synthase
MTSPDEPLSPTSYQFTDGSLARPALTRLWFRRLFPLLPSWLAANVITVVSTGVLLVVLGMSLTPSRWSPAAMALTYILALQIYVAGDHLDGMQAKATGTAGPLGDFLDHFCDLWAACILIFGFWTLLGTASAGLLYGMVALMIAAFAITFAEREQQRRLHFTTFGTLEAIVLLTLFLLSWTAEGARAFWRSELIAGVPWYMLTIGVGVAMAVGAMMVIVRRMGMVPRPVIECTAALVAGTVVLTRHPDISTIEGWAVLLVYGAGYVARVMHGYLVHGERSRPDRLATLALIGLALWTTAMSPSAELVVWVTRAVGAYAFGVLAISLTGILRNLSAYRVQRR